MMPIEFWWTQENAEIAVREMLKEIATKTEVGAAVVCCIIVVLLNCEYFTAL